MAEITGVAPPDGSDATEGTRTNLDTLYATFYEPWAAEVMSAEPTQTLIKAARDDLKRLERAGVNFRVSRTEMYREFKFNGERALMKIDNETDGLVIKIWVSTIGLDVAIFPDIGDAAPIQSGSFARSRGGYSAEPLVTHSALRNHAQDLIAAAVDSLEPTIPRGYRSPDDPIDDSYFE